MTTRLAAPALMALAVALAGPALAQAPDFGDDASQWSRDGECDDPRFEGTGSAQPPLQEVDALHDATDCRAAWEAGTVTLAGAGDGPGAATTPVKGAPAAQPAGAGAVNFGTDATEWANDGECDDRRFVGQGMAVALGWVNVGKDASDCRALFEAGSIRLWDFAQARAATQCASIDFGDDAGDYPSDGECDDARFEGLSAASGIGPDAVGHDATDCAAACAFGTVALRDY